MKNIAIASVILLASLTMIGCQKIGEGNQQVTTQEQAPAKVTTAPTLNTPVPVAASTLPATNQAPAPATTVVASEDDHLSLFGEAFKVLIVAIKKDTANGVIPPSPDDHFIISSIDSLTPEERLNLFKVIYIRAAQNENKSPTSVTPDTYQKAPLKPESPGDEVLQGFTGGR